MHFAKGQMPPAKAFWSLTMYDGKYFFVANPLNRYTLSSRSRFKQNQDGSVDLYIQNESPGKDKEANWLPAPKGKFVLMLGSTGRMNRRMCPFWTAPGSRRRCGW